jgi:MFS transporter, UMF1 family
VDLFDWATQPFFTLITTFVFAPYFATQVAATPAQGQALWGLATGVAGLIIAFMSPVLGAIADVTGERKRWIAVFSVLLMLGSFSLWWTAPDMPHAVTIALIAFVIATIGAEFATVFTNAMMPTLAPPERLGRLSGTGWAVGYLGGLVSLCVMLVFFRRASPDRHNAGGPDPTVGPRPGNRGGRPAFGAADRDLVPRFRPAAVPVRARRAARAPIARQFAPASAN